MQEVKTLRLKQSGVIGEDGCFEVGDLFISKRQVEELFEEVEGVGLDAEFAAKIRDRSPEECDAEACHGDCDDLLLEALESAGYAETVAEYKAARKRVEFWYA